MPWIVKVAGRFETEEAAQEVCDFLTCPEYCFELEEILSPPDGGFPNN